LQIPSSNLRFVQSAAVLRQIGYFTGEEVSLATTAVFKNGMRRMADSRVIADNQRSFPVFDMMLGGTAC
jgi:hypothetical protein